MPTEPKHTPEQETTWLLNLSTITWLSFLQTFPANVYNFGYFKIIYLVPPTWVNNAVHCIATNSIVNSGLQLHLYQECRAMHFCLHWCLGPIPMILVIIAPVQHDCQNCSLTPYYITGLHQFSKYCAGKCVYEENYWKFRFSAWMSPWKCNSSLLAT